MVVHGCEPSTGEMKTGHHWGSLASQPNLLGELQARVRPGLKQINKQTGWCLRNIIGGCPLASIHRHLQCTRTHARTHIQSTMFFDYLKSAEWLTSIPMMFPRQSAQQYISYKAFLIIKHMAVSRGPKATPEVGRKWMSVRLLPTCTTANT